MSRTYSLTAFPNPTLHEVPLFDESKHLHSEIRYTKCYGHRVMDDIDQTACLRHKYVALVEDFYMRLDNHLAKATNISLLHWSVFVAHAPSLHVPSCDASAGASPPTIVMRFEAVQN